MQDAHRSWTTRRNGDGAYPVSLHGVIDLQTSAGLGDQELVLGSAR